MNKPLNVSQQIARWLRANGIRKVFGVTGGGAMFLNHALGSEPELDCVWMHHEQACAMAAEGYARIAGTPAVVNVTTGPGGINALNGVYGAYTDSIPMLVLSGQVKRETCLDFSPVDGLRQLGDQEGPAVHMARPVTKYCALARTPEDLESMLPEALAAATSGRPGPAWIEIPLDIQSATTQLNFRQHPLTTSQQQSPALATHCEALCARLRQAHRPIILAGTGVRIAGAGEALLQFAEQTGIPVATAWSHDLIASDHPLFAGRPGTIGTRAGNFSLQNADFVLVIGSRLNIRQISYNWQSFARNAFVAQVDIDPAEMRKPFFQPDMAIAADALDFLLAMSRCMAVEALPDYADWAVWCRNLSARFPGISEQQRAAEPLNPYALVEHIFSHLRDDDIIVCGNASACIMPFQVGALRAGQRMFSNSGSASMGHDLPAAIGAASAAPDRRVICFAGDGSLLMNLQELQTLKTLGAHVIVIVIANGGYLSIRQTHENFFGSIVGATPDSGVDFPDFSALATAFSLSAARIGSHSELSRLEALLNLDGPLLIHVDVDPGQGFEPRIKSRMLPDGKFATPELDDMFPFLPQETLESVRSEAQQIKHKRRGEN